MSVVAAQVVIDELTKAAAIPALVGMLSAAAGSAVGKADADTIAKSAAVLWAVACGPPQPGSHSDI